MEAPLGSPIDEVTRLILDSIPGLVALLTASGDVEVVNRPLLDYFGQTLEELRHWGTNGTVHPEDLPHVAEVFSGSIASGTPYEIRQRFRRSDGVYRWFTNSGFPLRETNGRIVRWCVLLTDIEERTRAEEALRASERRFRLMVETIPALVWCGTPEGELDYLNQRAVEYLGRTAQSLAGGQWLELVHPDQRDATVRRWLHSATTGSSYDDVYRMRRADGQYRWIQSLGEPFHDTNGRIAYWYGQIVDIDGQRRTEQELRRSEAFLAEGQRLSRVGSFSWRVATDDILWSEQLYRIFDIDRDVRVTFEVIGTRIHPEDVSAFQEQVERSRREGSDVQLEIRLQMPDGTVKYVHVVAHRREDGGPLEYVGAVQDVTPGRLAEAALANVRSQLAHVARATSLGVLTASIAHEVNQPLSGIITNASTCLRMLSANPPDIDGARETARRTIRDGDRASDVITRLRALFSKKDIALEPLNLNEATQEVIALSLSELQRNRVIVQPELDDDLPPITGDRVQLQQVILNLVRNASEAMARVDDRPRQLVIRTEREGADRVRVMVRDAGPGIVAQDEDKLFEAFHTTKSGGMGIGLSISRSIVERHHGRLWAEPNDGPGATFAFSLPRHPPNG
jgi:PAS domain S-box-containing protein